MLGNDDLSESIKILESASGNGRMGRLLTQSQCSKTNLKRDWHWDRIVKVVKPIYQILPWGKW